MSVKIKKISQIRDHGKKKKRLGSFFVQGKAKILPSVKWKYFFEIRFSFEINFAVFGYAPAQNFIIFEIMVFDLKYSSQSSFTIAIL